MRPVYRLPAPSEPPVPRLPERARRYFLASRRGRVVTAAFGIWLFEKLLGLVGLALPGLLTVPAILVLWAYGVWYGIKAARFLLRKLLWRIRTKLILSYLFVAAVPLFLLVVFVTSGALVFGALLSSHLVEAQIKTRVREMKVAARVALEGLAPRSSSLAASLSSRLAPIEALHGELGFTLLRRGRVLVARGDAPTLLPDWLADDGLASLVVSRPSDAEEGTGGGQERDEGQEPAAEADYSLRVVARSGDLVLILDRPLDRALLDEIERETDLTITDPSTTTGTAGRAGTSSEARTITIEGSSGEIFNSVALVRAVDWQSGKPDVKPYAVRLSRASISALLPAVNIGEGLVWVLAIIGLIFLGLYAFALVIGLMLARSITRNVHALSLGTAQLREGRFDHRIPVRSRDQLGELAESFNLMAAGIQDLLREQAEKDRLEEELRIARQIQMSLLPESTVSVPGLRLAALCIPATEVGGDYYDLLPLSDERLAVVVADVSGKGTSAALYMAELKGLVLSLSRAYASPAALLSEANRILAANLDSRSFITMTYAVFDTEARCMRYARGGHSPIVQFEAATGRTRLLSAPGVGLGLDPGPRFDEMLHEDEVPLAAGDVFVFFTDGVSEALSPESELFGEPRLMRVIEDGAALETEELKQRILEAIRAFAGGVALHDDMTLVVLKVQ
jgi:serine phosphatase RsbU (regulator of sigma subunit)